MLNAFQFIVGAIQGFVLVFGTCQFTDQQACSKVVLGCRTIKYRAQFFSTMVCYVRITVGHNACENEAQKDRDGPNDFIEIKSHFVGLFHIYKRLTPIR